MLIFGIRFLDTGLFVDAFNENSSPETNVSFQHRTLNILSKFNFLINSEEKCSICMESSNLIQLQCKHLFHENCINEWVKNNDTCPICRLNIIV